MDRWAKKATRGAPLEWPKRNGAKSSLKSCKNNGLKRERHFDRMAFKASASEFSGEMLATDNEVVNNA